MANYIGDTHGNFSYMEWIFQHHTKRNFIHVGDFGMIFGGDEGTKGAERVVYRLNEALKNSKSILYVNRGNHDNPKFWNESEWSRSNIKFVPNYSVINIEGKNTLFLGGALSIDRLKSPKWKYFKDEVFVYDEKKINKIMETVNQIDVVVSHTAPEFCFPIEVNYLVLHYAETDPTLLSELKAERKLVGDVYRILNTKFDIKRWVYGHFHQSNTMKYNNTEFTCMGVNERSVNTY